MSGTVSVNSVEAEELQGQGKLELQRQILLKNKKKRWGEIKIKVDQVQLVYWKGKGTVKGNKKIHLLNGGEVTLKYYQRLCALKL